MTAYADQYWSSPDGLKLHYREYPGREDRLPVICLPGLTRNARDFEDVAERLAGERRVLCPEMRGRGDSAYAKDSATYNPLQYVEDIIALTDQTGVGSFFSIGTSLGGLMTMLMGMLMPHRLAGAVLNDIGPYIEPAGLNRIRDYVGQGRSFPTWMHAARALEEVHGSSYPDYEIGDWLNTAKKLMTMGSNARIVFDYDMKIAEPLAQMDPSNQPDLWPGLDGLASKPVLLVRGEMSDVLSAETFEKMIKRLGQVESVTVPRVGHAPTLSEPGAAAAIDRVLSRVP